MNTAAITETHIQSEEGKLHFPVVVRALIDAGVESYEADLIRGQRTFYAADGETQVEPALQRHPPVAEEFSAGGLRAALRAAQADKIRYPEFVRQITESGVMGYRVFLTGRRAVYHGRKGEIHIEEFPQPNA